MGILQAPRGDKLLVNYCSADLKNNLLNFTKYGILNKICNMCRSNCLHQRIPHLHGSLTFAVPGVSKLYKIEVKHYEIQRIFRELSGNHTDSQ